MENLDVIALGGNAILPADGTGTIHEQFAITRTTMREIAALVAAGRHVVMTHGNGPIVGNILLRNEAARERIPPMPLGICVADSQGGIGYMIQQVAHNALRAAGVAREVVTLVTQVVVRADDPAMEEPTKPIGPFFTRAEARRLQEREGWRMIEDANRGWRRVVPSPRPVDIVEKRIVRRLVEEGVVVITVGGGGIPVVERDGLYDGVEAVVDKDRATSVLARELGAERMIVVTDVDAVYREFGTPRQERIARMTASEAAAMVPDLPPGSMGSKLDAAATFVRERGNGAEAIITRPGDLLEAVAGRAGTRIVPDAAA